MIVDAHLDLAYNATQRGRDITQPADTQPFVDNETATVGLPDLIAGDVRLVFATIFCSPHSDKHAGYTTPQQAFDQATAQLDYYDKLESLGKLGDFQKSSVAPVNRILLLEGAECVRTIADAKTFFDRGVRLVGLAWQKTRYAGGTKTPGPLTAAGRELVAELDSLGIVHDMSHLAERAFWDLLHATDKLVIASHSNCRSIVGLDPGERHLTDAQIRAIVERGGVIGINFYDKFLLPHNEHGKRRATLDDVLAHVKHICDLAGSADHVAIGTDMDGGLGREHIPHEIRTIADLGKIREKLSSAGFDATDCEKVMSANWLRIVKALPTAG